MRTHIQRLISVIFMLLITSCSANTTPGLLDELDQAIWVTGIQERNRVGTLDPSSGEIRWVHIPVQSSEIRALLASHDQRYLAIVSGNVTSTISIYTVASVSHSEWDLQPYAKLEGYSLAQWSPDSNDLLLSRSYWSSPLVWKAESREVETTLSIPSVCSATWGRNSRTIIVSVCSGERQILAWSRQDRTQTPLLRFGFPVGDQFAIYAYLDGWSLDKRFLLLDLRVDNLDLTGKEIEAPIVLGHQYAVLDPDSRTYQLASSKFFGYPSHAVWIDSNRLLAVSPEEPLNPFSYIYTSYNIQTNSLDTVLPTDNSCVSDVSGISGYESNVLVKYYPCGDKRLDGFYKLDLTTGKLAQLNVKYESELSFLTVK